MIRLHNLILTTVSLQTDPLASLQIASTSF